MEEQIQLSAKDWKVFEIILDKAKTKQRPKLKKLIQDYLLIE